MGTYKQFLERWNQLQPLSDKQRKAVEHKFMLDFNYNSNHIEGNTLSYGQTELLLTVGMVSGFGPIRDFEEMKAHNVCLRLMVQEAESERPLTELFLRSLHQVMLREDYTRYRHLPNGTTTSYVIHAGQYKSRPNSVITAEGVKFDYATPEETPAMMHDLLEWYNHSEHEGKLSALELATLFHYRFIRIHPFEDGNGRMARLLFNFILRRKGWPMMVVRSTEKNEYLAALSQTDAVIGPFPTDGANASWEMVSPFAHYMAMEYARNVADLLAVAQGGDKMQWWYQGELLHFSTETPSRILSLLRELPQASVTKIAVALGISRSAIQKQLETLASKNYISRPAGQKRGWEVNATNLSSET